MKQASRKLAIGCLLLNNLCCILVAQCFTLLQPLTGFVGHTVKTKSDPLPHMHDEQRDMTRAAVSSYWSHSAHVFNHNQGGHHKKKPWIEQIWCWLSFVKCVSGSCVGEWRSTHLYVSCLVCFLIANAIVDWKRNISLLVQLYWEGDWNVELFNGLHRRSICLNKIMKLNEKRRNKTKPYCLMSEGRPNAESDFKSIFAV